MKGVIGAEQLIAQEAGFSLGKADVECAVGGGHRVDLVFDALDQEAAAQLMNRHIGAALDEASHLGKRARRFTFDRFLRAERGLGTRSGAGPWYPAHRSGAVAARTAAARTAATTHVLWILGGGGTATGFVEGPVLRRVDREQARRVPIDRQQTRSGRGAGDTRGARDGAGGAVARAGARSSARPMAAATPPGTHAATVIRAPKPARSRRPARYRPALPGRIARRSCWRPFRARSP